MPKKFTGGVDCKTLKFGYSQQLGATNLNDLREAGFYTIPGGSSNVPYDSYWHVEVIRYVDANDLYVVQRVTDFFQGTAQQYIRNSIGGPNGNWGPWVRKVTTGDVAGLGGWTAYTPAITYANNDTTLPNASATGACFVFGKLIHFRARVTTGSPVAGSDSLNISLPFVSKGGAAILATENAQVFGFFFGKILPGERRVKLYKSDLTYPVTANNMVFDVAGTYEAQ